MSTRHPESVRRLLEAIAREADPDRLLLAVAEDRALLGAARRLLSALDGADPAVELDFRSQCLARGLHREVARERLRLIVVSLDEPGSQPDPYEVLQVLPEATAAEIKRAFRQASFAWHPDRNPERPEAAERFLKIQEAYALLGDAERRRAYDRSRATAAGAGVVVPPLQAPTGRRRWSGWRRGPSLLLVILVLLAVSFAFDERRLVFRPAHAPPRSAPASQTSSETSGKSPDATAPAAEKAASQSSTSAVHFAALREQDELPAAPGGSGAGADQRILYGWERGPHPAKPAPTAVPAPAPAAPVATSPAQAPAVARVPKPESPAPPAAATSASAPAGAGAKLAKATVPSLEKQPEALSPSAPAPPARAKAIPAASAAGGASSRGQVAEVAPPAPSRTTVVAALPSPSVKAERPDVASGSRGEAAAAVGGASKDARATATAATANAAGASKSSKPGSAEAIGKGPPGQASGSGRVGPAGGREGTPERQAAAPASAAPAPPAKPAAKEETAAADDAGVIEERIRNFLDRYTRTFSRLDPAAFRALFDADAVENGHSFQDLQPQYEKNFRELAGVDYRIRVRDWRASRSSFTVTGTFALTARYRDERAVASQGTIELVLTPWDDGFRVRRLQYSFQR